MNRQRATQYIDFQIQLFKLVFEYKSLDSIAQDESDPSEPASARMIEIDTEIESIRQIMISLLVD